MQLRKPLNLFIKKVKLRKSEKVKCLKTIPEILQQKYDKY